MVKNKNRSIYFDLLRICATFAVVLIHCCSNSLSDRSIDSYWHMLNIYDSLCRCAVPVFFMISGALFLDKSRPLSIKKLYTKNTLRLFTAFVFWSVMYALFKAFINHEYSLYTVLLNIVKGHFHMWFIPAMIGVYILLPVLRKIAEDDRLVAYFLLICILLKYTPELIVSLTDITPFSEAQTIGAGISYVVKALKLYTAHGYVFYFFLGHFLHTRELTRVQRIICVVLGFISTIGIITLTYVASVKKGKLDETFYNYTTFLVFLQAQGVFVLFKNADKLNFSEKVTGFIQSLSKYTFGCYLIHMFFIMIYKEYIVENAVYPPLAYITLPLLAVVVFILSMAVSALLNHIPFIKKYIV